MSKNVISAITEELNFFQGLSEKTTTVDPAFYIFIDKDINSIVDELNSAGVSIDMVALDNHIEQFEKQEQSSKDSFMDEVQKKGADVKLNSRKSIQDWFFKTLGLAPYKMNRTGPSIDKEVMQHYEDTVPSARYYLEMSQAHSMVTMLNNIKKAVRDGRIYPHHNLNKAASGRFSSSGSGEDKLNINGWPKSIRDILKSDISSNRIVSFDYRNMEGMVSASMAHETSLIDDMVNDVDMHQKLADILGVDRKIAKIVNHGVNYGMTAFGLARKIGCTEDEAEKFIEKYWQQRPKIKTLKQDVIQTARMMGYISTISDFRRPAKDLSDDQIWSTFIQGSAADLFKEALTRVSKYLKSTGYGSVKSPMHDAIICEIDNSHLDEAVASIKDIMENIHPEFILRVEVEMDKW